MPEKNSALGQLNAMKARYTENEETASGGGDQLATQPRRLMASHYWRAGAILLAIFCGVFLSLAYRESKGLSYRRSQLQVIESRLADSENRLMVLSTEIGTMTAQKEGLTSELLRLRSEAANNAESSAENRILGKALPLLKSEYTDLVSKVASLRESKAELEGQVRTAEKKLADVHAAIEPQERALRNVVKDVADKQKLLAKIKSELADNQSAVTGAQRSLGDYHSQIETTKSAYEDLKKRLASMNDERDQIIDTITVKQADLNTVRANYNEEKSRLDILSAELKRLTASLVKDRKRAEDAEKRHRVLSDEVSALKAKQIQLSGVQKKLADVEAEISVKNTKNVELLQQLKIVEKRHRSLTEEVSTFEAKRMQLLGINEELNVATKELAEAKSDVTVKNIEIVELYQKLKTVEAAVSSKQTALNGLEAIIKKLEATQFDLAKQISRMQGQREILKQKTQHVDDKQAG